MNQDSSSDPFATHFGPVDLCGMKIPGFTVLEEIGRGAFGVVYRALDQNLDRLVAIKVALINDPGKRREYLREAQNAAKLDFPGIVTVHSVGTLENGQPFVVQRLIEGSSLRKLLETQGPFSLQQASAIMCDIAYTIAEAHATGIIHRDIKPDNILIDKTGKPWVADFGLAVSEHDQNAKQAERAGTPLYMSPEQLTGRTDWLDGRADIYSLGIMFYELLVGRTPFVAQTFKELEEQILYREAKPISQRVAHMPTEVDQIFNKCCAKKVTERYASAYELFEALQKLFQMANAPGTGSTNQRFKASSLMPPVPHSASQAATAPIGNATAKLPSQTSISTKRPLITSQSIRRPHSTKAQRQLVVACLSLLLLVTIVGFGIALLSGVGSPPHADNTPPVDNPQDVKPGIDQPADNKQGDNKQGDNKQGDNKPKVEQPAVNADAGDTKPTGENSPSQENNVVKNSPTTPPPTADPQQTQAKPTDTKSTDIAKSTDIKPTDTKPTESKPADVAKGVQPVPNSTASSSATPDTPPNTSPNTAPSTTPPVAPARPAELRVAISGTGSHTSVQAAIDVAVNGETILIESGNYVEGLKITKPVRFKGLGPRASITITGRDQPAVQVASDVQVAFENIDFQLSISPGANDGFNTIELRRGSLELTGCGIDCPSFDGIKAWPDTHLKVSSCDFNSHNHPAIKADSMRRLDVVASRFNIKALPGASVPFGIQASQTPGLVGRCEFSGEGAHGIDWQSTRDPVVIRDSVFRNCKWGIHLEKCDAATLEGTSKFLGCDTGVSLLECQVSMTGLTMETSGGATGIKVIGSSDSKNQKQVKLADCIVRGYAEGLAVSQFGQVTGRGLTLESNVRGVVAGSRAALTLEDCKLHKNSEVGLQIEVGSVLLSRCKVTENSFGARVNGSRQALRSIECDFIANNRAGLSIFSGTVDCSGGKFQSSTAALVISKPQRGESHGHPVEVQLTGTNFVNCEHELLVTVPSIVTENEMPPISARLGNGLKADRKANRVEFKPDAQAESKA